ncbi:MAG: glycoside hydrolase family 3 N-terminal domain-containing protein, partial [Flavobacteriaceae bacterium]
MRIFIFLLFFLALVSVKGQSPLVAQDSSAQKRWVEERYGNMTLEERLGQLFMVMVASDNKASEEKAKGLVQEHHIGGVIFSTGGPVRQAKMTNELQALSKTPLLVGMDAEWGLSMRLDSTFAFPWNMTLGAVQNNAIIERIGQQIGKHSKRLGVHINFAPVLDININPKNPIIGNRSFGEDRENVTQKASALMKGMHSGGILSCGKHFPGHGDTATDSHHALPIIDFSKKRLDSIELYPYRKLIDQGLNSVMVAHLGVPNLEIDKKLPSSLSEQIVSVILKEQMKFKGLVLTDALNMKGVTEGKDNGDVEVSAFLAGNDILLMPTEVGKAKEKLIKAYKKGRLTEERLAHSVKKILMAKYKVGLNAYKPVKVEGLYEDLNDLQSKIVYEEAMENAITVVKNDFQLLSIKNLENKKIAYVKFGKGDGESFLEEMNRYAEVDEVSALDVVTLKKKLTDYNLVIIGHHTGNKSPWESYKFTEQERRWLRELALEKTSNLVLVSFAKPYALSDVKSFVDVDAVVVAYQNSIVAQKKTAQLLFGAIPAHGVLPVSVHPEFAVNSTCQLSSLQRLGYSIPERVGMSSEKLREVDRLVKNGLDSLMYPGAQVLIARHGKVIYAKSFGSPTYGSNIKVDGRHKYDLASMTKILATLPLIMKMEEEDRIELNDTFQELIPEYAETEIA